MPKRTNDFQQLVREIQRALNGTSATVEESAMVRNPASDSLEEIDILVTFSQGEMEFRVGFSCRDHGRRGDKDWIRHLAKQREEMGLSRMVAVHSSGFSKQTRKLAVTENITLFHLQRQELHEVASEFSMPSAVFAVSVQASAEPCIDLVLQSSASPVLTSNQLVFEISIDGRPVELPTLHKRILDVCKRKIFNSLKPPGSSEQITAQSVELEVQYTIRLCNAVAVSIDRAPPIMCVAVGGRALVNVHLRPVDNLRGFVYEDTGVITGSAEFPYGSMSMTYCKKGERAWLAPIQPTADGKSSQRSLVFMKSEIISFRFREVGVSPDGAGILRAMLNPTNPSPSAAAAHTPRSRS